MTLVNALNAGELLRSERVKRGEQFDALIDELALTREEAECYIRFYEHFAPGAGQLSPVVDVKLLQVLAWLNDLSTSHKRTVDEASAELSQSGTANATTSSAKHAEPQEAKPANSVSSVAPVPAIGTPTAAASTASAVAHTTGAVPGSLTAEQKHFLLKNSPRLLMFVRQGKLTPAEAMRQAEDSSAKRAS